MFPMYYPPGSFRDNGPQSQRPTPFDVFMILVGGFVLLIGWILFRDWLAR